MKRLEFHITYICNHACIFCSEDERMRKYNKNPLSPIQVKIILIDRARKWFNHVNFTGGEPTLFPGFIDLLIFAKKLWYIIYVWTNGTKFIEPEFSREALKYIDELSLSVHWYDNESCTEQTGDTLHFQNFQKIIDNINSYKTSKNLFFSNIVINRSNYKNALTIVTFLRDTGYPLHQILISVIAPEGTADRNFWDLVFDLSDFQEDIPEIIQYTNTHWIILRFFGLPTCILWDQYKDYANDEHWEERHTIERFSNTDGKVKLIDIYTPDNSRKRTFVEKCENCKWRMKPCTWVFKKYLDYYDFR